MPFISACFIKMIEFDGTEVTDKYVVAIDEEGVPWSLPDPYQECQVGDWLEFSSKGGEVQPYSEARTWPLAADDPLLAYSLESKPKIKGKRK
jgi:hypothetical protein